VQSDSGGSRGQRAILRDLGRALFDRSSVMLMLRDDAGNVVDVDDRLTRHLDTTHEQIVGRPVSRGTRVLGEDGEEISILEHPAQVARVTGVPQLGRVVGLQHRDRRAAWFIGDFVPSEQGLGGHSVLTMVYDVTAVQEARLTAERNARLLEQALEVATIAASAPPSMAELVEQLRPAIATLLPDCMVGIASGDTRVVHSVVALPGMREFGRWIPVSQSGEAGGFGHEYVNNDLHASVVTADRVVGTDPVPARSACALPLIDGQTVVRGMLVAYSQRPGCFDDGLVAVLRRVAPALAAALARYEHRARAAA
jgi:GAF domain-containing protein